MQLQIQHAYVNITRDGFILGEDQASGGYPWVTNNKYPGHWKYYRSPEEAQELLKHKFSCITEDHGEIRTVRIAICIEEI